MTKKYKIKKEHLNDSGCFAYGGGMALPGDTEEQDLNSEQPEVDAFSSGVPKQIRDARAAVTDISKLPYDEMMQRQATAMPMQEEAPQPPQMQQQAVPQQAMPQMQQSANPYMAEAAIQGTIAKEQTQAYQAAIDNQVNLEADYQTRVQDYAVKRDQVAKYLQDNPVDANRYFQSKSDLGKASTAIGLILGGIGGGLNRTGQNVALDFLNKQIDNDVRAQVENRRGQENLLSQLEKQFGNETVARQVLQSTLQTKLANEINAAALKQGDKLAIARAQQASQALMAQANAPLQAIAKEQALGDLLASGKDPLAMGIQMDEKQSKRAVPGYGLANDPEVAKQLKQEYLPSYEAAKAGIEELKSFGTMDKFNPVSRSKAASIQQRLIGQMRVALTGPGALTEGEREAMRGVIANPTDLFSLANTAKLDMLQNALNKDIAARLKAAGLKNPQAAQQTKPQQQIQFKAK